MCREVNAEGGTVRQEKRKVKERVYGCVVREDMQVVDATGEEGHGGEGIKTYNPL